MVGKGELSTYHEPVKISFAIFSASISGKEGGEKSVTMYLPILVGACQMEDGQEKLKLTDRGGRMSWR